METSQPRSDSDPELERIVSEEEQCLERVLGHLSRRPPPTSRPPSAASYDAALLELRDQIATARLEDVPPLLEQMERLQSLATWRRSTTPTGTVDPKSPYFARLVLEENGRHREVLIGRSTSPDPDSGIRIVDWREAPVSRLYYRYQEGDSYDEVFGEREVQGRILVRRGLSIVDGELYRIVAPQGSFARGREGPWRRVAPGSGKLGGGQGAAWRPTQRPEPGRLGVGAESLDEDKRLKEITALIDARQFELITRPDSGLVLIQGGAGSGKTTIALHRLAYLAYLDPRRFRPDRMLVLVYNRALARYVSLVLPALGVSGVPIRTYTEWAEEQRLRHLPELGPGSGEDTPPEVTRIKKHPALLHAIDAWVSRFELELELELERILAGAGPAGSVLLRAWGTTRGQPVVRRLRALETALGRHTADLHSDLVAALETFCSSHLDRARNVLEAWADLLGNTQELSRCLAEAGVELTPELGRALSRIAHHASEFWLAIEQEREQLESRQPEPEPVESDQPDREADTAPRDQPDQVDETESDPGLGVDGREIDTALLLDPEDNTLLLRLRQKLVGPLEREGTGRQPLGYEHLVMDEVQDLSPLEIAVALDTVTQARSATLAGDVSQRLDPDNGFSDWSGLLGELGLEHVEIEPLRISYRSTREIMDFAYQVLGPLAPLERGQAVRAGAPVELFQFSHAGDSVTFLAEALRELMQNEALASVAVIARYPEQADLYYSALQRSEVPWLRRIAEQDFPFRPGIDVTDVRQVKGLEFDYVVLVEVSDASYPADNDSRYLLHIAATRAVHQLWVLSTGRPSPLLPRELSELGQQV